MKITGSKPAQNYYTILEELMDSIKNTSDALREFEDYFDPKPPLRKRVDTSFERLEKLNREMKSITKKLINIKVVTKG